MHSDNAINQSKYLLGLLELNEQYKICVQAEILQ